jgi:long-chain acyl-CoA synthetase
VGWITDDLELRRRRVGTPFLCYEPRPDHIRAFIDRMTSFGASPALVVDGDTLGYDDVVAEVREHARRLAAHGVRQRDRVLFLGHNSLPWVTGFWATIELGAIPVLGNAWWSGEERDAVIDAVRPVAVLTGDALDLFERPAADAPQRAHHEDDDALVLFTSGSTGSPRGAVLSHRAVIAQQLGALAASGRRRPAGEDGPTLLSAPLFHIGGLQALVRAAFNGATLLLSTGRFEAATILELIERHRVARWGAVPTMVSRVIADPGVAERDLTSLRRLVMGGAPIPAGLWDAARRAFPGLAGGAASMYGLSEAGGMVAYASARDLAEQPGTAGRLLPCCEIRIIDGDGEGIGEIVLRTPTEMTRYWKGGPGGPDEAGWLPTGDLGRVVDGLLFVVGRTKDVIIRGGENVASANVEAALLHHPDVTEVAVVGLPDRDLGEIVAAVITVRSPVSVDDLTAVARAHLAYFEVPTRWWIQDEPLPTTASGKVDKPHLLRRLQLAAETSDV